MGGAAEIVGQANGKEEAEFPVPARQGSALVKHSDSVLFIKDKYQQVVTFICLAVYDFLGDKVVFKY